MSHLLILTDEELSDIVRSLEVRVVDERRLSALAADESTRQSCQHAAERLETLISKLEDAT